MQTRMSIAQGLATETMGTPTKFAAYRTTRIAGEIKKG
jgi:hypothetical protein